MFLKNFVNTNLKDIKSWIKAKYNGRMPQFYTSCDVRDSGFKVAPVDTNIFPAGFNNLDEQSIILAQEEYKNFINNNFSSVKKILLLKENFSRNERYLDNISSIEKIISCGDFDITTMMLEEVSEELIASYAPDLIIMNNDMAIKPEDFMFHLESKIVPNIKFGWYRRRKDKHCTAYSNLIRKFADDFKIDPWLIDTMHSVMKDVDFKNQVGMLELAEKSEVLLNEIKEKYKQFDIKNTPTVFIKSNMGTFGMGVISITNPKQILSLNKKSRNSMYRNKGGSTNSEVLIQEGVQTIISDNGFASEDVVYMMNGRCVGRFLRSNSSKGDNENLNAPNAYFTKLPFSYDEKTMVAELAALASLDEEL